MDMWLTIGHTKIIMLITNPSGGDKQGHRSFTLKLVGWVAIFDVSQGIFGSVVYVAHYSKALFNVHQLKRLPVDFKPLQKYRCL